MLTFLLTTALAAESTTHTLPWATVDVLSTVEAGVAFDDGVKPVSSAGIALLAGPALLRVTAPVGEKFSPATSEIHGFSAGFMARLDSPRSLESYGRTFGGYVRYGHQAPGDDEVRATLAVGWRQLMDWTVLSTIQPPGQLDALIVAERRIFAPIAVTAHASVSVGNAGNPWRLGAGAGAMIGF